MDAVNRRERPLTDLESTDASSQNGNSFEASSRKRSESLRSRITLFDNKKPSHLPVKEGSPVVTREKLSRRSVFSPRSPIPSAPSILSATEPGLSTELNELPFCDIDNSNALQDSVLNAPLTVRAGSGEVAVDHEARLSQDEPEPKPKSLSKSSSLQARLQMFEQRNREAIDDNSILPGSSDDTRRNTSLRMSRRGSMDNQVAGASEHSVTERSIESSVKSFSDFDEETPQRKSWKPKRLVPTLDTGTSVGMQHIHEQGCNEEDFENASIELNDTKELDTRGRKSWKTKRVISVENGGHLIEKSDAPLLRTLSDHNSGSSDAGQNYIETDSLMPTATITSVSKSTNEKKLNLQDRINMFNKPSSPTPQKIFLSSQYMRKLIAKKSGGNVSKDISTISESEVSLAQSAGDLNSASGNASIDGSFRFDELHVADTDEPKMSLDRSMVWEKQQVEQKRTKSFGRRGELKQHNASSALIRQKNKDKNAVFAIKEDEEVSDSAFPEFAKDPTETKIIITALRKNFVFEDMDEEEMSKLVAAMEEVQAARGKDIITQGEPGDYFYVVAKGDVEFLIDGQRVGTAGPGNAFGELALLYRCLRSATVRAMDRATSLFRVDQKTFTIMMQSETKKSEEEKRELLQKIPFLSSLGAEDITRLCSLMGPVLFSTGDYIVRKGDQGSSFFIIRDGTARVTEIFVGGTSYEDISLERGDYFGEDALVSNEPRAANVVALTKGSAFAIDRESVCKVLGDFGSLISKTQDRQKLESMKIFRDADLCSSDFDNLAKLVTERVFAKGEVICKRKLPVEAAVYIVREGSVKIIPKDKEAAEIIKAGGAFGQDHILAGAGVTHLVSTYTAKVLEDCVCGVLTLEDCRTTFDTSTLGDRIFSDGNSTLETKRAEMRKAMQSNIKYEDLEKDHIIGEGQFGTVWLVRADPHKTKDKSKMLEFALKIQFKEDPVRRSGAIEAIKREMTVIGQLNHPFIIDLVDTYETDDQLMMLTEPVKGGELWSRIHRENESGEWTSGMPEKNAKFYALVIADVVSFMHRQRVIFRDLKPENVLIDDEGYPTLCDFGFAKYCPDDTTFTFCGTPNYLAPEIVLNRGHGAAVDHWALGVVTYEMITGENPFYFEGQDQMALLQAIAQEDFYPLPGTASNDLVRFISALLEKEPVQRLGSLAGGEKGVLKHEWFSELDIDQIRNKKAKAPDKT